MHRVNTTSTQVKCLARALGQTAWRKTSPARDPAGDVGRNRHRRLALGDIAHPRAHATPARDQLRNGASQVESLARPTCFRSEYPRRGIKPSAHCAALSLHFDGDAPQRHDVFDQADPGGWEPAQQRHELELANP